MSDRDWGPLLTLGAIAAALVAILAWADFTEYQRHHAEERQEAAQHDARNTSELGSATCLPIESGGFACTTQSEQTAPADEYAEADLHAQQDMAEWAFGVLLVSIGALGLTALGVWLLWDTLEATRATLREAEKTTKAALDAADESRKQTAAAVRSADAAETQLRDSRDPFFWISVDSQVAQGVFTSVKLTITNLSDTIGVLVGGRLAIKTQETSAKPPTLPSERFGYKGEDGSVITVRTIPMPKGGSHPVTLTARDLAYWETRDAQRLWVYGFIDYRDRAHQDRVLPVLMYFVPASETVEAQWIELDVRATPILTRSEEVRRMAKRQRAEEQKGGD